MISRAVDDLLHVSSLTGLAYIYLYKFVPDTVGPFKSFVMKSKAFRSLFCNPQKRFHTSPTQIKAVNHSSNSTIAFTKKKKKKKYI